MIPDKIRSLVANLRKETRENGLKWTYNSFNSSANVIYQDMNITLEYNFDYDSEVGSLTLYIFRNGQTYPFKETTFDSDYGRLLALYEEAMASDIGDFNFS